MDTAGKKRVGIEIERVALKYIYTTTYKIANEEIAVKL